MDFVRDIWSSMYASALTQFEVLWTPDSRIFSLYLVTSACVAYLIYRSAKRQMVSDEPTFLRFLFPRKVWSHPSAWLDLRYYVVNAFFGRALLAGLSLFATYAAFWLFGPDQSLIEAAQMGELTYWQEGLIALVFMVVTTVIGDFLMWACHYIQHKSPLLWQFHKVHHSSEVMHPVSNFREHPVDNVLYLLVFGFSYGIMLGLTLRLLGYLPSVPTMLGVPIMMFIFNIVGYNLRHSHVWLRWPGKLSMIFPSPAHHQVHHSSHPDHLDKNFAFMFPIWDVIFKTYEMPEDNRDVKFGIGEGNADELNTCLRLYWVPFRDAYRVMKAQAKGVDFNMSKPAPVEDDTPKQKIHPAE